MMPVLKVLRLLGRFPYSIDKSGNLEWRLFSVATGWACLSTSLLLATSSRFILAKAGLLDWPTTSLAVQGSVNFVATFDILQAAFTTWPATPKLADALNRWNAFQDDMKPSSSCSPVLLRISYAGMVAILAAQLLLEEVFFRFCPYDVINVMGRFSFNSISILGYYLAWLWVVMSFTVKRAFDEFHSNLIQEISDCGSVGGECLVSERRRQWLEMHSLATALCRSLAPSIGLLVLQTLYSNCVLMYFFITSARIGRFDGFEFLLLTMFYIALLSFGLFVSGQSAEDSVHLFLSAVELSEPCFKVGPVIEFNKPQLIDAVETICSFLVVMLQFDDYSGFEYYKSRICVK